MNDDYHNIDPKIMRLEYKYEKLLRSGKYREAKILGSELTQLWATWATQP